MTKTCQSAAPFDPFSDRLARDIRNGLSAALVAEESGMGAGAIAQCLTARKRI